MASITKGKTWADDENVTYTDLNGNFDTIYNAFNGNISDANIASGAGISPSKINGTAATLTGIQTLTNKTLQSPLFTGYWDGWIQDTNAWAYNTAASLTISGVDARAYFPKGTRLKLTDAGTTKYFVVIGAAYSASPSPATVVNITGGTDYSLSGGAITNPFYSLQSAPSGFPTWFNYTPTITWTGTTAPSGAVGVSNNRFAVFGSLCTVSVFSVNYANPGTAIQQVSVTLPVPAGDTIYNTADGSVQAGNVPNVGSAYVDQPTGILQIYCASVNANRVMAAFSYAI